MTVDFIRHTWQDWPSTETPITADELNRLEEGIAGLYSDLDGIDLANIEQTVDDLEEAVENFKAGVEITQEEYDNLTPEEKNNGTVYYITDAPSTPVISALDASYNNSTSGLQATNVQSAVDEVKGEIDELNSNWLEKKDLLYTNNEPTGVSATTLVSGVDLSKYSLFEMWISPSGTDSAMVPYRMNAANAGINIVGARAEYLGLRHIIISMTNNTISCENGIYYPSYSNYSTVTNQATVMQPRIIYGVY